MKTGFSRQHVTTGTTNTPKISRIIFIFQRNFPEGGVLPLKKSFNSNLKFWEYPLLSRFQTVYLRLGV